MAPPRLKFASPFGRSSGTTTWKLCRALWRTYPWPQYTLSCGSWAPPCKCGADELGNRSKQRVAPVCQSRLLGTTQRSPTPLHRVNSEREKNDPKTSPLCTSKCQGTDVARRSRNSARWVAAFDTARPSQKQMKFQQMLVYGTCRGFDNKTSPKRS